MNTEMNSKEPIPPLLPATGSATVDYQKIAYEARDILNCGHVANVLIALAQLHTRYNDALARIATLERESPNAPGERPGATTKKDTNAK